jgi:hypothetical protein
MVTLTKKKKNVSRKKNFKSRKNMRGGSVPKFEVPKFELAKFEAPKFEEPVHKVPNYELVKPEGHEQKKAPRYSMLNRLKNSEGHIKTHTDYMKQYLGNNKNRLGRINTKNIEDLHSKFSSNPDVLEKKIREILLSKNGARSVLNSEHTDYLPKVLSTLPFNEVKRILESKSVNTSDYENSSQFFSPVFTPKSSVKSVYEKMIAPKTDPKTERAINLSQSIKSNKSSKSAELIYGSLSGSRKSTASGESIYSVLSKNNRKPNFRSSQKSQESIYDVKLRTPKQNQNAAVQNLLLSGDKGVFSRLMGATNTKKTGFLGLGKSTETTNLEKLKQNLTNKNPNLLKNNKNNTKLKELVETAKQKHAEIMKEVNLIPEEINFLSKMFAETKGEKDVPLSKELTKQLSKLSGENRKNNTKFYYSKFRSGSLEKQYLDHLKEKLEKYKEKVKESNKPTTTSTKTNSTRSTKSTKSTTSTKSLELEPPKSLITVTNRNQELNSRAKGIALRQMKKAFNTKIENLSSEEKTKYDEIYKEKKAKLDEMLEYTKAQNVIPIVPTKKNEEEEVKENLYTEINTEGKEGIYSEITNTEGKRGKEGIYSEITNTEGKRGKENIYADINTSS